MATSESDDFESADEELNARTGQVYRAKRYTSIGSDSDDDVDYIPVQYCTPMKGSKRIQTKTLSQQNHNLRDQADVQSDKNQMEEKTISTNKNVDKDLKNIKDNEQEVKKDSDNNSNMECKDENNQVSEKSKCDMSSEENVHTTEQSKTISSRRERPQRQRKPKEVKSLGAKKLGAVKIDKLPDVERTPDKVRKEAISEGKPPPLIQECWEECNKQNLQEELKNAMQAKESGTTKAKTEGDDSPADVPEELLSNLKFKDIFKPDGWEGLGEDVELPDDFSDYKYQPVLNKLAQCGSKQTNANDSWGGWGNWGVSSLAAGVSTLTSHVSHGLSLLEETIGVPDPVTIAKSENQLEDTVKLSETEIDQKPDQVSETPTESQPSYIPSSFGFGNLISSVSSITKLVESTSSKVILGGLDTLETIGKKTMEVLQEGDPGLKKKRALFLTDADKPILSQVLREAKEKADIEEKFAEDKELSRKVHFESLFDDFQGLVHLEALEMLSKQCNMKIQQQLINLDGSDLTSMQETLDEVKDLCDLGDDEDEEEIEKSLEEKLEEAHKDLGVSIKYSKLVDIWNDISSETSLPAADKNLHREIFQKAISALAKFTAYSVERFHKTAELLLIKERRSTVNEADSLIQLTKTLTSQIGCIANVYTKKLVECNQGEAEKAEITSSTSTILLEAVNASSYIQEAFRLLIPILQVGAI